MQTLLPVTQALKTPNTTPSVSSDNSVSKNSETPKEKFDKILQREVSETSNKQEASSKTTQTDSSKSSESSAESNDNSSDVTASEQSTNSTVDNVLATTETKYQYDQALYPIDIALNTNPLVPTVPELATAIPTAAPISMTPTELSTAPVLNDKDLAVEGKSPQSTLSFLNPAMLQRSLAQSTFNENSFANDPTTLSQSLNLANSADFGKLFPVGADVNKTFAAQFDQNLLSSPIESSDHPFASINALSPLTPTHSNNIPAHGIHVEAVVGQPKWGNEFAQKIIWMNSNQQQVAEIHLNPANLGPVEVMLSITQDQATAQFVSPHAAVREAIQDALPRLKEMLADSGIQLGNVTVGAESSQQEHKQQQGYDSSKGSSDRSTRGGTETASRNEIMHSVPIRHQGIVNTFA